MFLMSYDLVFLRWERNTRFYAYFSESQGIRQQNKPTKYTQEMSSLSYGRKHTLGPGAGYSPGAFQRGILFSVKLSAQKAGFREM